MSADLTIDPTYGDQNRRNDNQFRVNMTNNYFQTSFTANGIGIARGIEGLVLAGGNGDEWIRGGSGRDVFKVNRGRNTIDDVSIQDGDVIDLHGAYLSTPQLIAESDGVRIRTLGADTLILGASLADLISGLTLLF